MDSTEFSHRLAEAARAMADSRDDTDTLQRVAEMTVDLIESCDVAGVCVLRSGRHDSCAHTHSYVQAMDDLQRELGEGPSVSGLSAMDVVAVEDLGSDAPWPRWGEQVVDQTGLRSYLGFRLFTDVDSIGTLNLYSYETGSFDYQDRLDGMVVAAHAAVAINAAVRQDQMHTALTSRQLIGEATGMLRAKFELTSEQAFGVLKRISSQQNLKLFAVAQHVVETGTLPPEA